jgi:anti-anti-sigma factor
VTPVELDINVTTAGRRCTIALEGELDMASAASLEAAVEHALDGATDELVLDMRGVTFTDSCGLRAILRGRRVWEDSGGSFFLIRSEQGEQHRLFHVSGLIGELTFRAPDEQAEPSERGGAPESAAGSEPARRGSLFAGRPGPQPPV